ncbi:MAG: hypothetical protein ACRYG6_07765 [Janthinobacterium lividum]
MSVRTLLAVALALGLGSGPAWAQTTAPATGTHVVRDPVLGTRGKHARRVQPSAEAEAKADRQPPGTENGNQPDRAAAGGGGR